MGKGTLCVYIKTSNEFNIDKIYDSNMRYEAIFDNTYKLIAVNGEDKEVIGEGNLRYNFKDEHHVEIFIGEIYLATLGYNTTTINPVLVQGFSCRQFILFLSDCRCYLEDKTEVREWKTRL